MTNDNQLEVWRAEFCESQRTRMDTSFFDGRFLDGRVEILFLGFCIAKRSMQPIELPKPYIDYDEDDNACKYWTKKQINDAITAAGYSYRVKE